MALKYSTVKEIYSGFSPFKQIKELFTGQSLGGHPIL